MLFANLKIKIVKRLIRRAKKLIDGIGIEVDFSGLPLTVFNIWVQRGLTDGEVRELLVEAIDECISYRGSNRFSLFLERNDYVVYQYMVGSLVDLLMEFRKHIGPYLR